MAEVVTVILAGSAVVAFGVLSYWRFVAFGLHRQADRRLFFADVVLIVGAIEILLDALVDLLGPSQPADVVHAFALICRGGFTAGALALVVSFPAAERRERAVRTGQHEEVD